MITSCSYCSVDDTYEGPGSAYERQQLPLHLSWSMTIHKSQGLTHPRAWIDLGKTEKAAGITSVALSRVRNLKDLILKPMTFERLSAIKKCYNYKYKVKEEERLQALAELTMNRYNYF